MEHDLKGNENYFELTGGSSYRGFELPGVDCTLYFVFFLTPTPKLRRTTWFKIVFNTQDVTCRSKSIIGKLVDKSIVLDNCRLISLICR